MANRTDSLIAYCRSLPHSTEDIKWGADLVFSVGGKMFACFDNGGGTSWACKVPEEEFDAYTARKGIKPAPYAARYFWVKVDPPSSVPQVESKAMIKRSYDLVLGGLSKRAQRALGVPPPASRPTSPSAPASRASVAAGDTAQSPTKQWNAFLARFTPEVAAVAKAARAKMRKIAPTAIEMVYDNYNGLVIGYCPTPRPSEAIFSLAIYPDHVTLCFLQGAFLPPGADPKKLLEGGGNQVRHTRLTKAADLDTPPMRALIRVALECAKVRMNPSGKPQLLIKSISPKQRPRRPKGL